MKSTRSNLLKKENFRCSDVLDTFSIIKNYDKFVTLESDTVRGEIFLTILALEYSGFDDLFGVFGVRGRKSLDFFVPVCTQVKILVHVRRPQNKTKQKTSVIQKTEMKPLTGVRKVVETFVLTVSKKERDIINLPKTRETGSSFVKSG